MWFISIYVTHPNENECKNICNLLLEKKLIACYNTFPINSSYWWNWVIDSSEEIVSILKTKKSNWDIVKKEIEINHSYEIPCIMKFEVEANKEYENWINSETIN